MRTATETTYHAFDSLQDAEQGLSHWYQAERGHWVGRDLPTYKDAKSASESVWSEGIEMSDQVYNELRETIKVELKNTKRQLTFSNEDGDEVDMDRLRSGQEFWRLSRRESSAVSRTVTICIQTSTPSTKSSEQCLWRGMVAVVAAEILEEAGHSVEIHTIGKNELTNGVHVSHVCLKRTSEPMDRSSLINALSGWYHRSMRFAQIFKTQTHKSDSLPIVQIIGDDIDRVTPDDERIFVSDVWNKDDAVRMITEEINKLAL